MFIPALAHLGELTVTTDRHTGRYVALEPLPGYDIVQLIPETPKARTWIMVALRSRDGKTEELATGLKQA